MILNISTQTCIMIIYWKLNFFWEKKCIDFVDVWEQ